MGIAIDLSERYLAEYNGVPHEIGNSAYFMGD